MPLTTWESFTDFAGPVRLEHPDGSFVAYAESARADAASPSVAQAWKPEDVKLVLYDALRSPVREVPGEKIIEFKAQDGPVHVVVVADDVEPESGGTVQTRG